MAHFKQIRHGLLSLCPCLQNRLFLQAPAAPASAISCSSLEQRRWANSSASSGASSAPFGGMKVGDVFELRRTFSEEDVQLFSKVSEDHNPLHAAGKVAQSSRFAKPVVHGMLVASMFSAVIGSNFPGAIYLSQKLKFANPTLVGDGIVAEVTVLKLRMLQGMQVASMSTICRKLDSGEVVVAGEAMCQLPSDSDAD